MNEVYEDAVETGSNGISGVISLVVFFGIIWIVSKLYNSFKSDKKREDEIKRNRQVHDKVAPYPEAEKKSEKQSAPKTSVYQEPNVSVNQVVEQKTFETDGFILSLDKKTLQKGKDVEVIHIPLGVERIQDNAFERLKHIKEIIIPEGVKEIGAWAFSSSSIEKVIIPSTVEKIGENTFKNCEKLEEIIIQEGVKKLGVAMFDGCTHLTKVSLPSTLTIIPDDCFSLCISLVDVNIPKNVKYIGDEAFCRCFALPAIDIPDSVIDIGIAAFRECWSLKSVVIPQKIVGLSDMMFYDSCRLETVKLPNNLTCIMSSVFYDCTNLKIKIPLSVSHIGKDAFMSCHDSQIEVPKGKKEWIESVVENIKGHVSEYDYEEEYVLTKEIEDRTKDFLFWHEEKIKRRYNEIKESMGLSNDDYFPDDNF